MYRGMGISCTHQYFLGHTHRAAAYSGRRYTRTGVILSTERIDDALCCRPRPLVQTSQTHPDLSRFSLFRIIWEGYNETTKRLCARFIGAFSEHTGSRPGVHTGGDTSSG